MPSSAFFSSASKSTFFAGTPVKGVELNFEGVIGESPPRPLDGEPGRLSLSKASNSASEKFRMCFGLNGTGVETREVRN